ncbi:ras-related protein Rab-1A-like isoform X1 [Haliotis asinina]|uniref:ras-related protein Rab-1A-like isoform X1 n=1 Tax=Haliotis asinina TaxID=109174 RepID=UPI003531FB6E
MSSQLPEPEYTFKILIIGDSGVGKSALLLRFTENTYLERFNTTIGVDFKFRTIFVEDKAVKLQIWDTSGQERFRAITSSYYRNIQGIIIMYDITSQTSFDNIERWIHQCDQYSTEGVNKMIVGNKTDLDKSRVVPECTAKEFAECRGMPYLETSVKENSQVDEVFCILAEDIINSWDMVTDIDETCDPNITLSANGPVRKPCCRV